MRMNNMGNAKQLLHPPTCAAKRAWLKIGMGCFEPLGLAVSIHEDLPFLTDLGNSYRLLSNTTFASVINEGVGEAIDFFLRAIIWGVFINLATIILLVMISVFYYCVKCLCYKRECHKAMLWGCGFLSILMTVLCIAMIIAGLWAEVELNRNLANFISNTSDADAYFRAEQARHWMVIGYLILIAWLLIVMVFCAVISPICKTTSPVVAMLAVFFITTLLTSLLTGVGFAFLIILADICVGLSTITDDPQCMQQGNIERLEFYCNDGYFYGFLLTGLGCGFIVMFVIIQIFGAFFAGAISGGERRNRVVPAQDDSCNPTAPDRDEIQPPEQFFVGETQYQTSEAPQNTSRLSHVDGPPQNTSRLSHVDGLNDFQSDFSVMVLATNDHLPPLYNDVVVEQNHSGSAADSKIGAALVAGNQNSHNEDTEL